MNDNANFELDILVMFRTDVDEKVMMAIDRLVDDGIVNSRNQLRLELGNKNSSLFKRVEEGGQSFQRRFIIDLMKKYNINEAFIYDDDSEIYRSKDKSLNQNILPNGVIVLNSDSDRRTLAIVEQILFRFSFKDDMALLRDMPYHSSIISLVKKQKAHFDDDFKEILIKKYRACREYIYTGEGEMFLNEGEHDQSMEAITREGRIDENLKIGLPKNEEIEFPFIDIPAYATFVEYAQTTARTIDDFKTATWILSPFESITYKQCFIVEVSGDSMFPTLNHKAKILIKEIPKSDFKYIQSGVYAIVFGNSFVTKRIKEVDWRSDRVRLYSDNERHGYVDVYTDDIHAVFKVLRTDQEVN